MTAIKSYTDIEQSRKLAEILPLKSADFMWEYDPDKETYWNKPTMIPIDSYIFVNDIPCWSLAALFGVLPLVDLTTPQLIGTPKTLYRCVYNDDLKSHAHDNAVDACYEMIIRLNELKML